MFNRLTKTIMMSAVALSAFIACEPEQQFTNENTDAKRIKVSQLSDEMAKVRDYVPLYAVVAHRGSTFWAPEETESAWRWAREMGVDYLESDLQATKDGIVLANHDENVKRTTNIQDVFSDYVPLQIREAFYKSFKKDDGTQVFTDEDIKGQIARDIADFRTYYTMSYYYAELLMLDSGEWFNNSSLEQARDAFAADNDGYVEGEDKLVYSDGQYVSALEDQIAFAEGKMLRRDATTNIRILPYSIKPEYEGYTLEAIYYNYQWNEDKTDFKKDENGKYISYPKETAKCDEENVKYGYANKYMDFVEYDFENAYVDDPQDTGNRPGIYIEFKESWLNPKDVEVRVYNTLHKYGWNVATKKESENAPFYENGLVKIGETNGKVILQTFSFDALIRSYGVFKGQVPMCYLLWTSTPAYATDLAYATPSGYADFIKWSQDNGAHIIGPAISGAPNNYPEMNNPWQAYMIRKSGMLNHPYSFDSYAQMSKYMGYYNDDPTEFDDLLQVTVPQTAHTKFTGDSKTVPVYLDGLFTNRSEFSLQYMIDNGFRCNANLDNPFHPGQKYDNSQAPDTVPDAREVLVRLGYTN